jgi:hypothetical protein
VTISEDGALDRRRQPLQRCSQLSVHMLEFALRRRGTIGARVRSCDFLRGVQRAPQGELHFIQQQQVRF